MTPKKYQDILKLCEEHPRRCVVICGSKMLLMNNTAHFLRDESPALSFSIPQEELIKMFGYCIYIEDRGFDVSAFLEEFNVGKDDYSPVYGFGIDRRSTASIEAATAPALAPDPAPMVEMGPSLSLIHI